jgi:hypothetical protein
VRDAASAGRGGVETGMEKDKGTDETKNTPGNLNRFEPGRELGPIDDRNEYEQRIDTLAADQRELAQESTRLADLCQYFSTQKIDIPPLLVERISSLRRLVIPERIRALTEINKALMEYLNDVGRDPGIPRSR